MGSKTCFNRVQKTCFNKSIITVEKPLFYANEHEYVNLVKLCASRVMYIKKFFIFLKKENVLSMKGHILQLFGD